MWMTPISGCAKLRGHRLPRLQCSPSTKRRRLPPDRAPRSATFPLLFQLFNTTETSMKRRTLLQAAPALICAPQLALAQSGFPNKAIRYIVPVAAGGGSDMVGRTVTERWGALLKQSFVVDNQGGGGGVIACQATMRAPADGYTLLQGYVATHGTSPATRK